MPELAALDLGSIWNSYGPGFAFRLANEARPNGDYLFANYLPEENKASYSVDGGQMIVRPTMALPVGMDSPYPEGGAISVSTFMERTAKIALRVRLSEAAQRELQYLDMRIRASTGVAPTEEVRNRLLNFYNLLVLQPNLDTFEYLRGRAIMKGEIDWNANGVPIKVDYQVPDANQFAQRTGTARYNGTASVFWSDIRAGRKLLRGRLQQLLMNDTTAWEIFDNPVNGIEIVEEREINDVVKTYRIARLVNLKNANDDVIGQKRSTDTRESALLTTYNGEAEVIDLANKGKTIPVPFIKDGEWAMIGRPGRAFTPGDGTVANPVVQNSRFENIARLGYTHLAPTTESGGVPGRWGNVRQPEGEEWAVEGRVAANGLPVIGMPDLLVQGSTALA